MTAPRQRLELLAPAKNAEFGREAILHGADAVYIGGPAFGARANAGNSVADIGALADFAHRYDARVLVALNTLLHEEELEAARRLVWQYYEAGADALIVQDMGLLELDLPPIELHASTQADIRTPEKARFLAEAGFSQMVLARELSLEAVRAIAEATDATLEFFVHGALCVAYSGLCNLSFATTGRSANRGECSQACRLPYSLHDAKGITIVKNSHLLSIKDNDQSANLPALIDAGVRSFKIEGRLKDLAYVKNVTAYYRRKIDAFLEGPDGGPWRRASSGRSVFTFTPRPEKTFNRGATDYFVNGRPDNLGAFASPKFVGEAIGEVRRVGAGSIDVKSREPLYNGDGIAFFGSGGELVGLRINTAEAVEGGYRLVPALENGKLPAGLAPGVRLYRNHDQIFLRQLEKKSAERRIGVALRLEETAEGFALHVTDENGLRASAACIAAKEAAHDAEKARAALRENLGKLGATPYAAAGIELPEAFSAFLPASITNALRRAAIEALDAARAAAYRRPQRRRAVEPPTPYPQTTLDYLGNVANSKSRAFYEKHGVRLIAPAFECGEEEGEVSLMITRHCLRYSFNLCPKEVKGLRPEPMILENGGEKLTLRFDCKACEMHVVGRRRG